VIILICLITSWFEIRNGKKCYFQYHINIHILSQFSTTLEKDFEKGFQSAKIVTPQCLFTYELLTVVDIFVKLYYEKVPYEKFKSTSRL
jgi:hypothetical protein